MTRPSASRTRPSCVMYRTAPLSRLTATSRSSTPESATAGAFKCALIFARTGLRVKQIARS